MLISYLLKLYKKEINKLTEIKKFIQEKVNSTEQVKTRMGIKKMKILEWSNLCARSLQSNFI